MLSLMLPQSPQLNGDTIGQDTQENSSSSSLFIAAQIRNKSTGFSLFILVFLPFYAREKRLNQLHSCSKLADILKKEAKKGKLLRFATNNIYRRIHDEIGTQFFSALCFAFYEENRNGPRHVRKNRTIEIWQRKHRICYNVVLTNKHTKMSQHQS